MEFPTLIFNESFYCKKLNRVIHKGHNNTRNQTDFDILKPLADDILDGKVKTEKLIEDMTIKELREIAPGFKIHNYANLLKADLFEAIKEAQKNPEDKKDEDEEESTITTGNTVDDQESNIKIEGA